MAVFQDRAAGRDNNFNLCRMLAATAVLISHAYPLSLGPTAREPLVNSSRNEFGRIGSHRLFCNLWVFYFAKL